MSSIHNSNIYLDANTEYIDIKLKKYFKKTSMVVTENNCLLLAHSAANVLASHRSIQESWPGEFLYPPSQSQPSVS